MVRYISCFAPYKRCDRSKLPNPCSLFPVPFSLLLTIYLLNLSTSKLCFHKT
ncbi:MAG: hypothetical protein F6K53_41095 [Moorea sp. SIO4A1]|uniref:hypothetical protein n=1 Tax=Moorena sp. SIO4A1 TaxID=2607835 RepID=UPI00144FF057|nr:hypothetical protein [Moorena sp. SIO4A1]NEQ63382.1 hypothetical protein [Moorena sp. SIO4A1]